MFAQHKIMIFVGVRFVGTTRQMTISSSALALWRPLLPYGYSYKASYAVPDQVKPSFVIFDIRALW